MKKKIKDCTLIEFIKSKKSGNDIFPLLTILKNYNRSSYSDNAKENLWQWLKGQLNNDFLNQEIEVEDDVC